MSLSLLLLARLTHSLTYSPTHSLTHSASLNFHSRHLHLVTIAMKCSGSQIYLPNTESERSGLTPVLHLPPSSIRRPPPRE
ncbi:hypothetical protein M758_7G010800 [Ceratodon purpureus]|nr:hypothetical protein M758_7G010800 [Ceratodon purpureus]